MAISLDRYLHPEVAAGNHDAVRRGKDCVHVLQGPGAFDLGDDEGVVTQRGRGLPDGGDIRGALDEGLADRVHPLFGGEFQAFAVVIGEGADAEIDAGQIEAFVGA